MRIASFPTLALAGVLAGPALWHGFVERDLDQNTALVRLLIAIPVAAVMLTFLHALTRNYGEANDPKQPLRVKAVTGEPLVGRRAADRRPPTSAG
jgi:hypothetical protein